MGPALHFCCLLLALACGMVEAQDDLSSCYSSGSIALTAILSILFTFLASAVLFYLWRKYRKRKDFSNLILETDPERGKSEYAFDNPGFKDPGYTPVGKSTEKEKLEINKTKWTQWSPLTALTTKSEKKKTMDDSAIDENTVKVVALRSHDFTGLGFNICGNMKEGIFIKDVLNRGPASESGKLSSGDRINSLTISFEHMVYEDALTILSYASPYEVIIEAKGGKIIHQLGNAQGAQPSHPVYRSSSCTEIGSGSKRRLFNEDSSESISSNYSSLQKTRSNMTTLERKELESPEVHQTRPKKLPPKAQLSPEQLKNQLEEKILSEPQTAKTKPEKKLESEVQKTENKFQKFGIRVLPPERSPKISELSQNENNINFEKQPIGIDEVDDKKPPIKKRESKPREEPFNRDGSINGSGIKRDANGIPQEIPNYMLNAAVAARSNRRPSEQEEIDKTPKKTKGKAPAPPDEKICKKSLDEIQPMSDDFDDSLPKTNIENFEEEIEVELRNKLNVKEYNSDSDLEPDNQSSVNTIELNSSDITIHQAEDNEDRQNRKTASTGDLTKIHRTRKSSNGTLERAQSLDITDTGIPCLSKKRKGARLEDEEFGKVMMNKEPRLSLILDGLNTFQRNRLKKSTEWGNLEDAILKLNQEDENCNNSYDSIILEDSKFGFGETIEEFDALVNKINEIKKESIELPDESPLTDKKNKNQIWPSFDVENKPNGAISVSPEDNSRLVAAEKRQRKPPIDLPTEVEKKAAKPALPQKKDFLLKKVNKPEETANISDEGKSKEGISNLNLIDLTRNFIFTEKIASSRDDEDDYLIKSEDTNIPDDIKVSRHSLGSLERPKSDDAKMNISNVIIGNDSEELHSLEIEMNSNGPSSFQPEEISELYTTALDSTLTPDPVVTISTPDIIKNATLTEAINKLNNDVMIQGPSSLTLEIPNGGAQQLPKENKFSIDIEDSGEHDSTSLTYITEIQVLTPNNKSKKNISEIEIIPNINNGQRIDHEFDNYVRTFETNVKNFESNIQKYENQLESPPQSLVITENKAEKELHKIQEIAEEQFRKLPEMRFSTSSYESPKTPEKRMSQIELLRSNFEKSSPKNAKADVAKSRIPIATTAKTPPTSPERRDSRNLDFDNEREIIELMSSTVHSTPMVKSSQVKPQSKNVTVTSIRSNSKIPSGLPILSGGGRLRKLDDDHVVQVSTNGGVDSSFKQWVFNPTDHSVTNIVVAESKQQK